MILTAALIFAAIAQVDAGDSEMVNECRIVGARTEGLHTDVRAVAKFGACIRCRARDRNQTLTLPHRHLRLGIIDIFGHTVDKALQFTRPLCPKVAAAIAIRVEVRDRVCA